MPRRWPLAIAFSLMLTVVVMTGLAGAAPPAQPRIAIRLAPDLPQDLTTTLVAEARGEGDHRVLRLTVPGLAPQTLVAQRQRDSKRVWLIASVSSAHAATGSHVLPAAPLDAKTLVTIRSTPAGLQVLDAGRPVLFYATQPQTHEGKFARNGFVHPLIGLDGEQLTEVFPADHRHHHGVFWAWHQLWVGDQRAGDPWVTEDFLAVVREARVLDEGPVFASLKAKLHWLSPRIVDDQGQQRPIVEETTTIRVFHATESAQLIDFEIRLKPLLDDVRLGGAENARGYSGFTLRVRPPKEMRIVTEAGSLESDAVGQSSRWADVSGKFLADGPSTGVAILSHRSLAEFPPRWLLRFYGMQNVVYPGREPIRLSATSPLVLRHRLHLHRGDAAAARVADQQKVYEALAE